LDLAFKVGLVIGPIYPDIIIGGDCRDSTPEVKEALFEGLSVSHARYVDAGFLTTPTLAYAARKFSIGIMVTASHNPPRQ
jgi:phosphoglucosamine mutase